MLRYLSNTFSLSIYSYDKYQVEQINSCCQMTSWRISYFTNILPDSPSHVTTIIDLFYLINARWEVIEKIS